jgi:hypothetical protein
VNLDRLQKPTAIRTTVLIREEEEETIESPLPLEGKVKLLDEFNRWQATHPGYRGPGEILGLTSAISGFLT